MWNTTPDKRNELPPPTALAARRGLLRFISHWHIFILRSSSATTSKYLQGVCLPDDENNAAYWQLCDHPLPI
ncbi:hypothetical protein [Nostoc parmelioides]|uniref:hypothetical protein n=1 Tax=Nostoc parmelioides TaxID=1521621 RepID=UPI001686CC1C|nr:hypothetical protein [Nostoc parmelioides]